MEIFMLVLTAVITTNQVISSSDLVMEEWDTFKLTYGKTYDNNVEDHFRKKIYLENRHKIAKHNAAYAKGLHTFSLEMNKYGDMLPHEVIYPMTGSNTTSDSYKWADFGAARFISPANVEVPDHIDWRNEGAVTPVKDQKHCGSCWAFSATGALEGQNFRKTGKLIPLSEQNLIDCSRKYGNDGCSGGHKEEAFIYIKDNKGIDTEESYPYEAKDNKCRYDPHFSEATDVGFTIMEKGNEKQLKEAVATVGPIAVSIDASLETFHFYKEGVYYDPECSSKHLNHAVLVVGYGTQNHTGQHYWLVKNSWGTNWGEEGYVKIARNRHNTCGVASRATYPLV